MYLFDWESPAFDGLLGSSHGLELPFVFGAVHVPVVQVFSGGGPAGGDALAADADGVAEPSPRAATRRTTASASGASGSRPGAPP